MNAMTQYGTESIEIDIESPEKQSSSSSLKSWCLYSEKIVYVSFTVLTFLFMILYLSNNHFFVPNVSKTVTPLSQMKIIESSIGSAQSALNNDLSLSNPSNLENCGTEQDISCDPKYGCMSYQNDIQAVYDKISKRFEDYAEYILDQTQEMLDIDGCIADKFNEGHLICSAECESLGYILDAENPNLCKNTFLDEMKTVLKPYRRACIASLMGHQFASMCGRRQSASKDIEIASFTWWAREYSIASTWSHYDCPYYI